MLLIPYPSLCAGTEFGTPPHDVIMTTHCHIYFWSLKNVITQWSATHNLHLLPLPPLAPRAQTRVTYTPSAPLSWTLLAFRALLCLYRTASLSAN